MYSHILRLAISVCFLLVSFGASAQWNSFIVNFKKDLFGRGAQTWQIKAYDENYIFCGNKNGIIQYNGNDWSLHALDNRTDVRSIHISNRLNRIYAGGESEFGYFEANENGELVYTNLSEKFNNKYSLYGGYWGVFEVDNILYYVSDKHVAKEINNEFTAIISEFKIDCSAVIDGILYVGTTNGLRMLVGNTWLAVPGGELLHNKTIRAIVPYKKGYLVATAFDGLFYGNKEQVVPFITGAEEFMYKNEIFSLATRGRYIAIGSIHNGLLLINTKNNQKQYYNEQNGLQNNTVLSLCFDKNSNLWLGLDNGIDYIPLNSSFTNLYTNPHSKGTGYAAFIQDGRLYLGTNRGLFYSNWPVQFNEAPRDFPLITELSGQVWGLEYINNELFCLHDKGLYLIKGDKAELIPGLRGALICAPYGTDPNRCWVGSYDGLFLLEKKNSQWSVSQRIDGVTTGWMRNVLFESSHVLWVRDNGLTRIVLDTLTNKVIHTELYNEAHGFDSIEELYVHKIGREVRFSSISGIYKYNKETNRITRDDVLSTSLLPGKIYSKMHLLNNTLYALSADMIQVIRLSNGLPTGKKVFPIHISQIDFIKLYEGLTVVDESTVIIPNEYGFALLDANAENEPEKKEVFIRNIAITYPKNTLVYTDNYLKVRSIPRVPYNQNSLRFEYGIRSFGELDINRFRYRLLPDDTWSEWTTGTVKEYSNLTEGRYTFEVETVYADDSVSGTNYSFSVLPPWYRTVYAWVIYLILILVLFRVAYILEERRLLRKRREEIAQKEKEMILKEQEFLKENLQKEQEIVELKNEKLEQDLKHKGQEMANLMINFSRKNEILISIKEELSKIMGEMKGDAFVKAKRMLLTLNNSIDSNMESDDVLKRFEEQFDLVHNNFIRRIRDKHPDLTVSERKMCAYLKMNLSSKEIAPLLNISVRGVETLRYRLRKKFGLERDESLTEYLNSFA